MERHGSNAREIQLGLVGLRSSLFPTALALDAEGEQGA